ncbi:MAG: IclR family transcriptional regulator [Pseudomonadota bacterium]
MSSLEKMLGLLDLFTTEQPIWSSEDLILHLGAPASTCYRYLKVLHRAGYLSRVASNSYVLGPRIMELDRVSRESDPVYLAGSPAGQRLTLETGHSSLLCILFSDSVMCIQQARGRDVPASLFTRGQRRPLVAGASAKSILAHLPMHQLRILYARHTAAIAEVGLGRNWEEFKAALKLIRQTGYSMSVGEYHAGIVSIAAPLFNREGEVLGSLALTASAALVEPETFRNFAPQVVAAGKEISTQIALNETFIALPARALG